MKDYDIEKLVNEINFDDNFIGYNNNGIILTNREVDILKRNNIDYSKFSSVSLLVSEIDEVIEEVMDEGLDEVANNIVERNYYLNTKK